MQHKLYSSENNLQYIKRLQALKYWLLRFDELLDNRLTGEYAAVYESYFCTCCGFSFMIESVILYWTTNMVTNHSKEYYI